MPDGDLYPWIILIVEELKFHIIRLKIISILNQSYKYYMVIMKLNELIIIILVIKKLITLRVDWCTRERPLHRRLSKLISIDEFDLQKVNRHKKIAKTWISTIS